MTDDSRETHVSRLKGVLGTFVRATAASCFTWMIGLGVLGSIAIASGVALFLWDSGRVIAITAACVAVATHLAFMPVVALGISIATGASKAIERLELGHLVLDAIGDRIEKLPIGSETVGTKMSAEQSNEIRSMLFEMTEQAVEGRGIRARIGRAIMRRFAVTMWSALSLLVNARVTEDRSLTISGVLGMIGGLIDRTIAEEMRRAAYRMAALMMILNAALIAAELVSASLI